MEVDESRFSKHAKNGAKSHLWVIGFYERGSKDVRAFVIEDKSEATILALMRENIVEGADVVTDSWRGYAECKQYFNHRVCLKQRQDPEKPGPQPGAQDNNISRVESLWHMLKRNIHTY